MRLILSIIALLLASFEVATNSPSLCYSFTSALNTLTDSCGAGTTSLTRLGITL